MYSRFDIPKNRRKNKGFDNNNIVQNIFNPVVQNQLDVNLFKYFYLKFVQLKQ